jgi:GNAT superfamily N-acetyltransferase
LKVDRTNIFLSSDWFELARKKETIPSLGKSIIYFGGMLPSIKYRTLTPNLVGKAVDCIAISFTTPKDPFTKVFEYSQTQWGIMSQMFVERAAESDLSIVAFNEAKNRIEGVMINEDWKELPPSFYRQLRDWRPVRAIFNELHIRFKSREPRIEHGKVLHPLYFSCVHPESRRKGIATNLWNQSVEVAKARNYDTLVAETSVTATERLCHKLGFKLASSVEYHEFLFEGRKPFAVLDKNEFQRLSIFKRPITSDLFI